MALVYYPPVNHPVVGPDGRVTVVWLNYFQTVSGSIIPGGGPGITVLTGEVTTPVGGGPQPGTITPLAVTTGKIADNAVTYAKLQNMPAETLLGRGAGGGAGDPQEITLGAGLSMAGTVLSATASGTVGGTAMAWLGDESGGGDTYYQMLGGSFASDGAVCAPLTDGDPTQPELIFAGGDVVMVCA